MSKNIFIFVVCGAKEHIDTLHFSLPYLQKRTKNEIWILTDSTRNEIPIQYNGKIIDVLTPKEMDNHQASIYLKTGIYQFVPKGNRYCYLDTDIIAMNDKVDQIFEEYIPPIMFAPDHCKMKEFSASAINCGCQERWVKNRNKYLEAYYKFDRNSKITDTEILKQTKQLRKLFIEKDRNKIRKLWTAIRFKFSHPIFKFKSRFFYDKREQLWRNEKGDVILYDVDYDILENYTGLKYDPLTKAWYDEFGENIFLENCHHLKEQIQYKFHINVLEDDFQHWNGGVFLFDDDSHNFLVAWFNKTMDIFKDEQWKTRDQGTLIATVWEFGLQRHPILDKKWNLIADYSNEDMEWEENKIRLGKDEIYTPNFIHVYHRFNDYTWDFWNQLIERV